MFVYQNANRDICVTFKDNKPVENPEYVITIDNEAGTLSLNGSKMTEDKESSDTEQEPAKEEKEPEVPAPQSAPVVQKVQKTKVSKAAVTE